MEIFAKDHGIGGLVMPEELSKIICDFARVKIPADRRIGEWAGACAICFGRRPDYNKRDDSRYCKGCYYEYGGGGFGHDNTYERFDNCVKCGGEHRRKITGYVNCPLCIVCYATEKKKIYLYINENSCGCGKRKKPAFATCFECRSKGLENGNVEKDAADLKNNINNLIKEWEKSRMCQLDDDE